MIGVGNVGTQVVQAAKVMGLDVMECDPPKMLRGELDSHVELDKLLRCCDIVTLHVPLVTNGEFVTENMADEHFFSKMKKGAVFINSSRGEVVDQEALKRAIRSKHLSHTVLDVWRNEPEIDRELMMLVDLATPHIAAEKGDFAKTVLMPGDPLRAKYIAENYLEDAVLVNNVRGVQGYTGYYRSLLPIYKASGLKNVGASKEPKHSSSG